MSKKRDYSRIWLKCLFWVSGLGLTPASIWAGWSAGRCLWFWYNILRFLFIFCFLLHELLIQDKCIILMDIYWTFKPIGINIFKILNTCVSVLSVCKSCHSNRLTIEHWTNSMSQNRTLCFLFDMFYYKKLSWLVIKCMT